MEKTGFVYIWYDKKRKMFYVGCHWGNIFDGYICSSNRMRDAYRRRPNDFKRRILKNNISNRTELLDEEHKWLCLIDDEELNKKYYNASKKRFGHWSETKNKSGKNHPMFGKTHTIDARKKISESKVGKSPWNKGKKGIYSKDTLKLMGAKNIGNLYNLGKKHNDETRKKMSDKKIGIIPWNKNKKMKWVTNTIITKQIPFEQDIPNGWMKGRKTI